MPLRASQPSASPKRPAPRRERRSAGTIALLAGIVILVVGAGAFAASQLLGSEEPPPAPNTPSQPATSESPAPAAGGGGGGGGGEPVQPPAETVVAVLNGTTFNGLAGTIADQLGRAGYQRGATLTNPDQTIQVTTVYFADGARGNARRIARRLNTTDVQPVSAEARTLAPDADVIVLAGADQAP
jgi:hypothetical protein